MPARARTCSLKPSDARSCPAYSLTSNVLTRSRTCSLTANRFASCDTAQVQKFEGAPASTKPQPRPRQLMDASRDILRAPSKTHCLETCVLAQNVRTAAAARRGDWRACGAGTDAVIGCTRRPQPQSQVIPRLNGRTKAESSAQSRDLSERGTQHPT